jgi:hypothetical protein
MVKDMPPLLYPQEWNPVPIEQETGGPLDKFYWVPKNSFCRDSNSRPSSSWLVATPTKFGHLDIQDVWDIMP